jgi:hypothetical protein
MKLIRVKRKLCKEKGIDTDEGESFEGREGVMMMAVLICRGCQAVAREESEHSIPSMEQEQRLQNDGPH